jgi:hypothetical protein
MTASAAAAAAAAAFTASTALAQQQDSQAWATKQVKSVQNAACAAQAILGMECTIIGTLEQLLGP